tara:strand:- start:2266 stop:2457 length:192 start_codon:yes stop_codon:yes gene_type:complete
MYKNNIKFNILKIIIIIFILLNLNFKIEPLNPEKQNLLLNIENIGHTFDDIPIQLYEFERLPT